jgi:hypothetical protein
MNRSVFNDSYIKYELYRHITNAEIHTILLEIPKYCIRFLFIHLIVRKNGISCEVYSSSDQDTCSPILN